MGYIISGVGMLVPWFVVALVFIRVMDIPEWWQWGVLLAVFIASSNAFTYFEERNWADRKYRHYPDPWNTYVEKKNRPDD